MFSLSLFSFAKQMALFLLVSNSMRTRTTVAAFSLATSSLASATRPFVNNLATKPSFITSRAKSSASSIVRASTASAVDLEKTLEVTHDAFDVLKTDVVNEYGAYCTLYRHKKSGAELLSVSSEDDNKVRVIVACVPLLVNNF